MDPADGLGELAGASSHSQEDLRETEEYCSRRMHLHGYHKDIDGYQKEGDCIPAHPVKFSISNVRRNKFDDASTLAIDISYISCDIISISCCAVTD